MSVRRSPVSKSDESLSVTGGSTSQPDLSTFASFESQNISIRKRKTPEDDFSYQFNEFKNEIFGFLKNFGKSQTENLITIKQDISSINNQLIEMKNKTDQMITEHNNFKSDIQNLTSTVNNTEEKIKSLENDIQVLQNNQFTSSSSEYLNSEDMMTEIHDRIERSKNVIITGISEPQSDGDMAKKREADLREVNKIIQAIQPLCPHPVKVIRLGRYDANKTRAVKVCYSTQETAKIILKNKSSLKDSNIKIYSDQTPNQQRNMVKLREELRLRKENGEKNLIIKYIKGIPKIIQESKNLQQEKIL